MDSEPRPRYKSQLTLLKTLKQVFDLLEPDQEGFVHTQLLVKLASRFGPHEQVLLAQDLEALDCLNRTDQMQILRYGDNKARKLVECLDPNSQGKISFLNFCFGVLVIKAYQRLPQTTDDIPSNNIPLHASPRYCQVWLQQCALETQSPKQVHK